MTMPSFKSLDLKVVLGIYISYIVIIMVSITVQCIITTRPYVNTGSSGQQGCISCGTCSYPKLTEDHVLTSAYVKIFRTVTRNAVNKGV